MYAVVVKVTLDDFEQAQRELQADVVPRVSQQPGFVAGYWLRPEGDQGLSMVLFESEDAARAAADRVPQAMPASVTLESIEVREVIASA